MKHHRDRQATDAPSPLTTRVSSPYIPDQMRQPTCEHRINHQKPSVGRHSLVHRPAFATAREHHVQHAFVSISSMLAIALPFRLHGDRLPGKLPCAAAACDARALRNLTA